MRLNELKSVNYGRQELFSGLQKDWFSMCNLYKKANFKQIVDRYESELFIFKLS